MIARLQEKDGLLQHEVEQRKLREEEPYKPLAGGADEKAQRVDPGSGEGDKEHFICNRKTIKDADRHKEGDFAMSAIISCPLSPRF